MASSFGLLTADGDVDVERTARLVEEAKAFQGSSARPVEVTFHRAIDMARSLEDSLEDVIRTGAQRILTSGAAQSALLGSSRVAGW